jgi:hypothetical protein
MENKCLNCNDETVGKFCNNCSQATSTHRFSLSHVFKHDFIHGIFHFDKGFFYTLKELFTRPGHSVREYIQGKRVKHFNYFAMILLLLTISYFLKKWSHLDITKLVSDRKQITGFLKVTKDYSKFVIFLHIPILALTSFLLFKKSKQNYIENLVINLFLQCGLICISTLLYLSAFFTDNIQILGFINEVPLILGTFIYLIFFYYQYYSVFGYNKWVLLLRAFIFALLYLVIKSQTNQLVNFVGLRFFH